MELKSFVDLSIFGIKTILFKMKKTILGTIILTDYCNLSCKHCAVNNINYKDIKPLCKLVKEIPNLKSISFNFHTPYEGTEHLELTREQQLEAINSIKSMIKGGYPVFNLYSALDHYLKNDWERPCYQCIVSEKKKRFTCGRCIEIDGLCEKCGYLFAVEFSLLFKGNPKVIFDMVSIGIQSFEEKCLKVLGRAYINGAEKVKMAAKAGFTTIDVDLIFGIAGQTKEDLQKDFNTAFKCGATQVSTYPFIDFSYADNKSKPLGKNDKKILKP